METTPTRTRLITAMADALQRRGLHGVGLNEILRDAQAPKGVLYHHFPGGKTELAVAAIQAIVGGAQSQRQFDQDTANAYLVDKLTLPGTGPIRAMAVEVRLRAAASSLTSNDSMGLEWLGTSNTMAWSGSMQRFASLGFQWVVGDDHVFCWDLAELPRIDTGNVTTGYANILTSGDDGFLDLYVQDDTDVDYVKVWIVRC